MNADVVIVGAGPAGIFTALELLRRLCRIDGIEWIRLHYAYPAGFPDEVIEAMATSPFSMSKSPRWLEMQVCGFLGFAVPR